MNLLELVETIITSVTSVVVALIAAGYFQKYRKLQTEKQSKTKLVEQIQKDELIHFSLREIRRKYNVDRVFIVQYHNGGQFYTDSPMQRASITYERCSDGLERLTERYQNILVSNFAWYNSQLLKNECFYFNVDNDIDDITMKSLFRSYGTSSHCSIPIYDRDKHLVAVLGFDWVFSDINEEFISDGHFTDDAKESMTQDANSLKTYLI
jgi:hypothetical protein